MKGISRFLRTYWSRIRVAFLRHRSGVEICKSCLLKGWPYIWVADGGQIRLGENVVLNSTNRRYHVGLYGSIKLVAIGPEAIISIGSNTRIHGSTIQARSALKIGKNCLIAGNCQILDNSGHEALMSHPERRIHTRGDVRPVTIEDDVWIGMNSIILPGSIIGRGAVISAGSVVRGRVEANSVYAPPSASKVSGAKRASID